MTPRPLRLKKHEERRLRAGHVWVFSNEVDVHHTPLNAFEPGDPVVIEAADGKALGTGYVNPHSLICARLVSRDPRYVLDKSLLVHRLNVAASLRERLFPEPYYRLLYGEADGVPGLVIDRFGDVFVVQITTAGVERVKQDVLQALEETFHPRAVLLRNDTASRQLEGLPSYVESALGEVPEHIVLREGEALFNVPLRTGQKTGWFYDQRMNRARMRAYVRGRRVLDLYSYIGAWGVQAAHAGAEEVQCIDSSDQALAMVRENAHLNDVTGRIVTKKADVMDALKVLREERARFDVVVLDPPAFIKRKKDQAEGLQAYRRVNQLAMQVLSKDGVLISCSCSYHLPREALVDLMLRASRHLDRHLQLLEQGEQAPDHPVHPAIPETSYLKCMFARLLPA